MIIGTVETQNYEPKINHDRRSKKIEVNINTDKRYLDRLPTRQ